jgi:5'-nucleotidase
MNAVSNNKRYQILLTNDDGIESPGLWAAAHALSELGYVWVVAPRDQSSGAGRSMPTISDGHIEERRLTIGKQEWDTFAVGGTPAQAVLHGVLEIMPQKPDLVVSGINYGENPGTDLAISGTVGGAMEGAACGVPSIAASLQIDNVNVEYKRYSREIDFSTAAYFTQYFARLLLEKRFPPEAQFIKLDVPYVATPQTPWRLTRLAHYRYFNPMVYRKGDWSTDATIEGIVDVKPGDVAPDTDVYALVVDHVVSVTPLDLDMTARVDFSELDKKLR